MSSSNITNSSSIKVKRLDQDAIIPTRGSQRSAGWDLYSLHDFVIPGNSKHVAKTGIAISIPDQHYGRVAPRSGLTVKYGINIGAGVIDSDYRGEIGVVMFNHGNNNCTISKGDRIAQLIIEKINTSNLIEVDDLDNTQRGSGGYGSTGT